MNDRSAARALDSPANPPVAVSLEDRLVDVALHLLEEEGLESLSLRHIARRAGVSHSAPLRPFRSFADLLAAVAARGFALLSEAVETSAAEWRPREASSASRESPSVAPSIARLAAAGRAYINVAVAHPGLFALMFRPDELDVSNPAFERESRAAFEHLVRLVRAAQDAGWQPGEDTRLIAGSVWSAVHGLATLWSQGAFAGAIPTASLEDAVATTLRLVLATPEASHE